MAQEGYYSGGEGRKGAQGTDPYGGAGLEKALPEGQGTRPELPAGGTDWLDLPLFVERPHPMPAHDAPPPALH